MDLDISLGDKKKCLRRFMTDELIQNSDLFMSNGIMSHYIRDYVGEDILMRMFIEDQTASGTMVKHLYSMKFVREMDKSEQRELLRYIFDSVTPAEVDILSNFMEMINAKYSDCLRTLRRQRMLGPMTHARSPPTLRDMMMDRVSYPEASEFKRIISRRGDEVLDDDLMFVVTPRRGFGV